MRTKKPKQPRAPRRTTVGFEKHSGKPPAIVDRKFIAPEGSVVYAWRTRSGCKPSWYRCQVIKVADDYVQLWDELFGQWFCFNPQDPVVPDIRLSA